MTVLDIFSWLPAKEISLEDIEKIVPALYAKKATIDGYTLETDMSEAANENVTHNCCLCLDYDLRKAYRRCYG